MASAFLAPTQIQKAVYNAFILLSSSDVWVYCKSVWIHL